MVRKIAFVTLSLFGITTLSGCGLNSIPDEEKTACIPASLSASSFRHALEIFAGENGFQFNDQGVQSKMETTSLGLPNTYPSGELPLLGTVSKRHLIFKRPAIVFTNAQSPKAVVLVYHYSDDFDKMMAKNFESLILSKGFSIADQTGSCVGV